MKYLHSLPMASCILCSLWQCWGSNLEPHSYCQVPLGYIPLLHTFRSPWGSSQQGTKCKCYINSHTALFRGSDKINKRRGHSLCEHYFSARKWSNLLVQNCRCQGPSLQTSGTTWPGGAPVNPFCTAYTLAFTRTSTGPTVEEHTTLHSSTLALKQGLSSSSSSNLQNNNNNSQNIPLTERAIRSQRP